MIFTEPFEVIAHAGYGIYCIQVADLWTDCLHGKGQTSDWESCVALAHETQELLLYSNCTAEAG